MEAKAFSRLVGAGFLVASAFLVLLENGVEVGTGALALGIFGASWLAWGLPDSSDTE